RCLLVDRSCARHVTLGQGERTEAEQAPLRSEARQLLAPNAKRILGERAGPHEVALTRCQLAERGQRRSNTARVVQGPIDAERFLERRLGRSALALRLLEVAQRRERMRTPNRHLVRRKRKRLLEPTLTLSNEPRDEPVRKDAGGHRKRDLALRRFERPGE